MKPVSKSVDGPRVSPGQVAAFRLSRHHLVTPAPKASLARVAGDMCGAQAQVMSAAQLSLRARIRGLRPEDVERALWRGRTLVKAWCMRGTTHLLPSKDFAVFVGGCARRAARSAAWMARAGYPVDAIDRAVVAAGRALDRPLTRKELADRVAASIGTRTRTAKIEHGWGGRGDAVGLEVGGQFVTIGGILHLACGRGIALAGPERGNEATFVGPSAWIPGLRDLPVEEAEMEFLRRYLRAFGPATVRDFAWWTYLTAADAREVWGRLQGELAAVDVGGRVGWALREDIPALRRAKTEGHVVRLLPYFDAFLLGHKDKGHLVEGAHYKQVYRPAAWVSPAILVDGRAAGVWSHERKGGRVVLRAEPFGRIPAEVRDGIETEAEDVARFLGGDLEFRISRP